MDKAELAARYTFYRNLNYTVTTIYRCKGPLYLNKDGMIKKLYLTIPESSCSEIMTQIIAKDFFKNTELMKDWLTPNSILITSTLVGDNEQAYRLNPHQFNLGYYEWIKTT